MKSETPGPAHWSTHTSFVFIMRHTPAKRGPDLTVEEMRERDFKDKKNARINEGGGDVIYQPILPT